MPAVTRKRKVSPNAASSVNKKSRGLDAFTKVSKAVTSAKVIGGKEGLVEDSLAVSLPVQSTPKNKKRKLDVVEEESASEDPAVAILTKKARLLSVPKTKSVSAIPRTPQKPIPQIHSSSVETPTKSTRSLLDNFRINNTPTRSPLNFHSSNSDLAASTPAKTSAITLEDLPAELHDIRNLHTAFLTALSIHYAHNGTHSPADLRNICPDVAKCWGKRAVTLEDIRRTLGIMNSSIETDTKDRRITHLYLSDYGYGKICIEIKSAAGKAGRMARPINEDLMNSIFANSLLSLWKHKSTESPLKQFIKDLPLESITTCSSAIKVSPMLAKGQRRLEDLKAGITIKKEAEAAAQLKKKQTFLTPTSATAPGTQRPSLLERLRLKQAATLALAPTATPEALARIAALNRIPETVSILTVLSTASSLGQTRVSFTLSTIVGRLQDSMRNGISKKEAEDVVKVLAEEVAPEWVKIVKFGKGEGSLVVDRMGKLRDDVVRGRVERCLIAGVAGN